MTTAAVHFITHPDVVIDPAVPVPRWRLSPRGLDRMRAAARLPWMREARSLYCSREQKALDGAAVLAAALGLEPVSLEGLGENDRSASGFLEREEFERVADEFFARPSESVRGWERAVDAQARVAAAVEEVLAGAPPGNVLIVSHGAVGALLLCRLGGRPISRADDQPPTNGGNYLAFERESRRVLKGWTSLEED
ncbi:MAG TPA: histidine phosphatase family protein [Deinococcales bacterium]|nr:histidine phosphatase family protein [Deinococcales bacterium]